MKTNHFEATTRWLIFLLPLFMGAIEYLLRLALKQPDANTFFPISLVASSVGLSVALTEPPTRSSRARMGRERSRTTIWPIFIANMGIFASLGGVVLWLYLLMASFSDEVRLLLPWYPLSEASAYYVLLVSSSLVKDRMVLKWQ